MWRNYVSPRQVADELTKFIRIAEFPTANASQGTALADAGYILLKLKEQLLYENKRLSAFPADFVSRNTNGIELLLRTLVILQRMLHESSQSQTRISSLLNRNSNNRSRKVAVAEADCLECTKMLLEKTNVWAYFMDFPGNVEVVLFSITSPQLDSKCYALEIARLLLNQPSGFVILLKALTTLAANNRDENRITLLTNQLKHGLHTSKLHIQILIVRLLNAMISQAPSFNYRLLTQIEAENAGFSPERLEQIVNEHGRLSGLDLLQQEMSIWRNNLLPLSSLQRSSADNSIYRNTRFKNFSLSADSARAQTSDDDTLRSERSRRLYDLTNVRAPKYNSQAPVERQRLKRYTPGDSQRRRLLETNGRVPYGDQTATGMVHPINTYFPPERALQLNRSFENLHTTIPDGYRSEPRTGRDSFTLERPKSPRRPYPVKRAKSESTVFVNTLATDDEDERSHSMPRNPVMPVRSEERIDEKYYAKPRGLSRSAADLNRVEPPPESSREQKKFRPIEPMSKLEPLEPFDGDSQQVRSVPIKTRPAPRPPARDRIEEEEEQRPLSPRSVKMQGFSYLFPNNPVADNVVRRAKTPEPHVQRTSPVRQLNARPPSAPVFEEQTAQRVPSRGGEHVVYIPVRLEGTDRLVKPKRSIMKGGQSAQNLSNYREQASSSVYSMGEDVKDALSKFDYLNDYETSSRGSRYGGAN